MRLVSCLDVHHSIWQRLCDSRVREKLNPLRSLSANEVFPIVLLMDAFDAGSPHGGSRGLCWEMCDEGQTSPGIPRGQDSDVLLQGDTES